MAPVAQTIGDSRLVRLFEPVLGTPFARLERVVYAPLCLFVAISVFHVAATHRAQPFAAARRRE